MFRTLASKRRQIQTGKEMFARAKENRRHCQMHFIYQRCLQELLDDSDTTAKANVHSVCCLKGPGKG